MAFVQQAWGDASAQLSAADHQQALGPEVDRLATALYLVGEETDATTAWARAYHESVGRGEFDRAARCGFWLSHNLLPAGDAAQSRAGSPAPSGCSTTSRRTVWSADTYCS